MSLQVLDDAGKPGSVTEPAPGTVNPLEPMTGPDGTRFPLQSHASLLRALFVAVFDRRLMFPQILSAGILRSYQQAGWNLITGEPAEPGTHPAYPTLSDLEAAALSVMDDAGYGPAEDDMRALVRDRIRAVAPDNAVAPGKDGEPETVFHAGVLLIRLIEHLRLRRLRTGAEPGPMRSAPQVLTRLLDEIRAAG
ncbi:MAG TPA: hypothetical protein VK817_16965 [Trebonia sp.]|jgi:hypothetical protein|nr:hypothetical protein [Trebonia sp.]